MASLFNNFDKHDKGDSIGRTDMDDVFDIADRHNLVTLLDPPVLR